MNFRVLPLCLDVRGDFSRHCSKRFDSFLSCFLVLYGFPGRLIRTWSMRFLDADPIRAMHADTFNTLWVNIIVVPYKSDEAMRLDKRRDE